MDERGQIEIMRQRTSIYQMPVLYFNSESKVTFVNDRFLSAFGGNQVVDGLFYLAEKLTWVRDLARYAGHSLLHKRPLMVGICMTISGETALSLYIASCTPLYNNEGEPLETEVQLIDYKALLRLTGAPVLSSLLVKPIRTSNRKMLNEEVWGLTALQKTYIYLLSRRLPPSEIAEYMGVRHSSVTANIKGIQKKVGKVLNEKVDSLEKLFWVIDNYGMYGFLPESLLKPGVAPLKVIGGDWQFLFDFES